MDNNFVLHMMNEEIIKKAKKIPKGKIKKFKYKLFPNEFNLPYINDILRKYKNAELYYYHTLGKRMIRIVKPLKGSILTYSQIKSLEQSHPFIAIRIFIDVIGTSDNFFDKLLYKIGFI